MPKKPVDVLLLNVPTNRSYKKDLADAVSMPPLGLMYLASHLIKGGYTVDIIDMAVEFFQKNEFIDTLNTYNAKVIGISTFVESWSAIQSLARLIRQVRPDSIMVAGGSCASFCYGQLLREMDFNYVVIGEGEYSFRNLVDHIFQKPCSLQPAQIQGIAYQENNRLVVTEPSRRITELDELEFPERSLIRLDKYVYPFTISTARGCPGECIFCSSRAFWGRKIKFRSPENIIQEVMQIEEQYGIDMFFIVDDTFTMNVKRAKKFCQLLMETGKTFIWGCESRADVASTDLLQSLYDAGCRKIQFGMESGNNEILQKIGKKVTVEQIEAAVKMASAIGFDINVSFIIGHPFDDRRTVEQTIRFALYLRKTYGANVLGSINTPYPGTKLYDNAEEYGMTILTDDWNKYTMDNAIIHTANLSALDIREYYQRFVDVLLGRAEQFVPPAV